MVQSVDHEITKSDAAKKEHKKRKEEHKMHKGNNNRHFVLFALFLRFLCSLPGRRFRDLLTVLTSIPIEPLFLLGDHFRGKLFISRRRDDLLAD